MLVDVIGWVTFSFLCRRLKSELRNVSYEETKVILRLQPYSHQIQTTKVLSWPFSLLDHGRCENIMKHA